MHNHWIITNREVRRRRIGGRLIEVVTDARREALPTFRVATFSPSAGTPTDDTLRAAVQIIPDTFADDYAGITPATDPSTLPGSKRLFKSLYDCMHAAPEGKGDTLFFIHGFNYSWTDALTHLHQLHKVYVEPPESPIATILYFSWPSWGKMTKYKKDQQIAQPSGLLLGRFFAKAIQFYRDFFAPEDGHGADFCGRRIHIGAHSMGNQVLQEFFRSIREYDFLRSPLFGEVLLLNADIDWTALEPGSPLHALPDYADRIHAYNHRSDDALLVSEATKNRQKRLGRHGPRDLTRIPPRTLVVDATGLNSADGRLQVTDRFVQAAARVLERDAVSTKERLFDHWGYLNRAEVVADIYQVLRGVSSS
ncbi:hypothetical protein MNBD_PLANCTO03-1279, partial [hydrothermal vent metagenome]